MKLNEEERLKLFNDNQGVAHALAYRYNIGMEIEDTKQEALLALWVATERFDPERSESFATYAYWIVSEALQRNIVRNRAVVSVPRTVEGRAFGVDLEDIKEDDIPTARIDVVGVEVEKALDSLPVTMHVALRMKMGGASVRTIGNRLKVSHMTAHNIIKQALERLEKYHKDKE